jgi:hypothetical protein
MNVYMANEAVPTLQTKQSTPLQEQHFIHQQSQILRQIEDDPPVALVPLTQK